jgi:hypothetical protein
LMYVASRSARRDDKWWSMGPDAKCAAVSRRWFTRNPVWQLRRNAVAARCTRCSGQEQQSMILVSVDIGLSGDGAEADTAEVRLLHRRRIALAARWTLFYLPTSVLSAGCARLRRRCSRCARTDDLTRLGRSGLVAQM